MGINVNLGTISAHFQLHGDEGMQSYHSEERSLPSMPFNVFLFLAKDRIFSELHSDSGILFDSKRL